MEDYDKLMVGDQSTDGRIIIADKDRLCYLVKSGSKGSFSIRTISKQLLGEFIDYYKKNPNKKAEDARVELKELSDIDKYEYGVAIQTKSTRILRDLDILKSINAKAKTVVQMTMTTYDLPSPDHDLLMDIFRKRCAENGIIYDVNECFQYLHVFPEKYVQMSFVDNLQ